METLVAEFPRDPVRGEAVAQTFKEADMRIMPENVKQIEAMRQALGCYRLLHARDYCVRALTLLTKMKTSELSEEALENWALTLAEAYKDLEPLNEAEPLARATLAGLGLPPTIEEFEDYDGNRCRIKLNLDRCTLASDSVFGKLQAALVAWNERT